MMIFYGPPGGGGGGGGFPDDRNLQGEIGGINQVFKGQELPLLNKFFNKQPLIKGAQNLAIQGYGQAPGFQDDYQKYIDQISGSVPYLQQIVNSGGKLTPEQEHDVQQSTAAGFASRGNLYGNQSLGGELLNRDQFRQGRFDTALQQLLGVTGSEANLTDAQQGVIGKAIQPGLSTEQTGVGSFATLMNPLLNYGSDLYNTNYNSQAAQAIGSGNQKAGTTGSAIGAVGSIVGGVAIAY